MKLIRKLCARILLAAYYDGLHDDWGVPRVKTHDDLMVEAFLYEQYGDADFANFLRSWP